MFMFNRSLNVQLLFTVSSVKNLRKTSIISASYRVMGIRLYTFRGSGYPLVLLSRIVYKNKNRFCAVRCQEHERSRTAPAASPTAKSRRRTFLDQFLTSSEAGVLTRNELFDELRTLLLTGAGTSMDFQSLFLMCMALQPEVQRKVQKVRTFI